MEIAGMAIDGLQAFEMTRDIMPDVLVVATNLPELDGFGLTSAIMATFPVPIVMVCPDFEGEEPQAGFSALEAGALAIIEKPEGFEEPGFSGEFKELVSIVRVMSHAKVKIKKPYLKEAI